ncbi:hypothetical protein K9E83_12015 [Staphylococcus pseudintermedius]|nr:hypothetical protein K9E83_12015 [Staphylococcus pseudintermedius]
MFLNKNLGVAIGYTFFIPIFLSFEDNKKIGIKGSVGLRDGTYLIKSVGMLALRAVLL